MSRQGLLEVLVVEILKESILDDLPKYVTYKARRRLLADKLKLKWLGVGSSREAFQISKRLVIKLAIDDRGQEQNKVETRRYKEATDKSVLAAVTKVDPEGNWLIMELVKPFESQKEFTAKTGLNQNQMKWLSTCYHGSKDIENVVDVKIKYYQGIFDRQNPNTPRFNSNAYKENNIYLQSLIKELEDLKTNKFFQSMCSLGSEVNALQGDNEKFSHYGTTVDGRVVMLDYGVDEEVAKSYAWSPYAEADRQRKMEMDIWGGGEGQDDPEEDEYGHPVVSRSRTSTQRHPGKRVLYPNQREVQSGIGDDDNIIPF